jgi:hypothetical protein
MADEEPQQLVTPSHLGLQSIGFRVPAAADLPQPIGETRDEMGGSAAVQTRRQLDSDSTSSSARTYVAEDGPAQILLELGI